MGVSPDRNRFWYAVLILAVIAAGLGSRVAAIREVLGQYPGDALWAVMVYLGWSVVFPKAPGGRIALLGAGTCVAIEFLKLWQVPWLVQLRHTTLGHLVFGHVFSWANLLAYAAGLTTAFLIERACATRDMSLNT